jgi:hypothetical protein
VKEVLTEDYQTEITPEQAVKIANDKLYENWNDEEKVRFQLFTPYLAMPLSVFHEAIENVL